MYLFWPHPSQEVIPRSAVNEVMELFAPPEDKDRLLQEMSDLPHIEINKVRSHYTHLCSSFVPCLLFLIPSARG